MWTKVGFLTPIIVFQMVYCKSYSAMNARNPRQFQWQSQSQSLNGGQSQSLYMLPVITGIGSSSSSSSGNGGIKIIHSDDEGGQRQSQFFNIDDGVIKIPSITNKKGTNNNNLASYMSASTDKNGIIKIKISSPKIHSIADNIKISSVSEDSEEQDRAPPVIRYVYTSSNKKGNEDKNNKNIIKIHTPTASASASASSSGEGQSQSQTVTIQNGHIVEEISDNNDKAEDEIEVLPQVQFQSNAYDSIKGHRKSKPTLRGKTNIEDGKDISDDDN